MINLLPQQQKDELKEEESFKLVLILEIVVLAFLISLFLILFSIKILIEGQLDAQKFFLEQKQKQTENMQLQSFTERIKSLNSTLAKFNAFYQEELDLVKISEIVTDTLPPGIYLTSLNFNRSTDSEKNEYSGKISLTGHSPARQDLIDLKKKLEAEEKFGEVYFPPENWVEPVDINFNVSFKIK